MGAGCDGEAPSRRSEVVQVVGLQKPEQEAHLPFVGTLSQSLLQDLDRVQDAVDLAVSALVGQRRCREAIGAGELRIDFNGILEQPEQLPVDGRRDLRRHVSMAQRQHLDGL